MEVFKRVPLHLTNHLLLDHSPLNVYTFLVSNDLHSKIPFFPIPNLCSRNPAYRQTGFRLRNVNAPPGSGAATEFIVTSTPTHPAYRKDRWAGLPPRGQPGPLLRQSYPGCGPDG